MLQLIQLPFHPIFAPTIYRIDAGHKVNIMTRIGTALLLTQAAPLPWELSRSSIKARLYSQ